MSVSKLESLPNEILIEILEKYINAIDIIKAFAFQLNQRFDAIITQSQRLRFDFINCHKDDFRFCMGLLPAYFDKVQELTLAERHTPGQMHAFFSFYPSFGVFKHLRKLYLQLDMDAVGQTVFENALHSLSTITLHTLSLQISLSTGLFSLDNSIVKIFRMKTLKKLSIDAFFFLFNWKLLKEVSSNIKYLAIHGMGIDCYLDDLGHIFRCASGLRYLDIGLDLGKWNGSYRSKLSSTDSLPLMSMLHTAIFDIGSSDETMLYQLEACFRCIPSLHHLEIRTPNTLSSVAAWETLIQTALPSLTSFTLEIMGSHLTEKDICNALAATETAFWTKKQHFHVIIKKLALHTRHISPSELSNNENRHSWDETITQWCIAPLHKLADNSPMLNRISSLCLNAETRFFPQNPYLNNVTHLVIDELNDHLLQLITTHVNCSQIEEIVASSIREANNKILSLLSYTTNIRSLRINLNQLCDEQFNYLRKYDSMQFLDISGGRHSFNARDISLISSLFPHLEHLTINTKDLQNVPMLQRSLPHLRSLTFRSNGLQRPEFLFRDTGSGITVWIDQAVLQDSYWLISDRAAHRRTPIGRWLRTKFKNMLSSFNSF